MARSIASSNRVYGGLDLCRLLSSLAVIVYHHPMVFETGLWHEADRPNISLPLTGLFGYFYSHGQLAVPLFWIISGFIFFWKYSTAISDGEISAYRFFVLRFSRLYPIHFFTLVMVGLLPYLYLRNHAEAFGVYNNDIAHFVTQLFFASNWLNGQSYSFNFPIWSVSAEVLVYGLFFALLVWVRPSLVFCVTVVVLAKITSRFLDQPIIRCLFFFFIGGGIQSVVTLIDSRFRLPMLILTSLALALILELGWCDAHQTEFAIILVLLFIYLGECLNFGEISIANTTYSSYLLHFPLQIVFVSIVDLAGYSRDVFSCSSVILVYLAVTYLLAFVAYQTVELWAQSKLRFWLLGKPAS